MSETRARLTAGWWFALIVALLFLVGFVGWLVQGAGDDETVPTITVTSSTVTSSTVTSSTVTGVTTTAGR